MDVLCYDFQCIHGVIARRWNAELYLEPARMYSHVADYEYY